MSTLRLPEHLHAEATAYAEWLGLSLNALCTVALREYLDARPGPGSVLAAAEKSHGSATAKTAPAGSVPRVAKGQPCPCGSGRTYGKCHGRAAT